MNRLLTPNQDLSSPSTPSPSPSSIVFQSHNRPLRIVATGTVFLTHHLVLPSHPAPGSISRAHGVTRRRGGGSSFVLKLLMQLGQVQAQPAIVEAQLIAPLAGNDEGRMIMRELENEGLGLRYCKIWEGASVPSAWVLHSGDTGTTSVINHNPLPDITHEEFVSLLGPLLAPENYTINYFSAYPSPSASPVAAQSSPKPSHNPLPPSPRPSSRPGTGTRLPISLPTVSPVGSPGFNASASPPSPAPFDWLHFEGRSIKTTLNNMVGVDSLARERKWRGHCVFSVDMGKKARAGVEFLMPHADVIFTTYQYALSVSPSSHPPASPRAFLLSLLSHAPKHALIVAYWGQAGAAVLSVPTREYFQSSGWVSRASPKARTEANGSIRSASEFYAGVKRTPSGSTYTAGDSGPAHSQEQTDEDSDDGTEVGDGRDEVVDETGAQDAFVAGMIYALSRKLVPGMPWTPTVVTTNGAAGSGSGGEGVGKEGKEWRTDDGDRWRLEECLRFATELAGRKARRKEWDGVVWEMASAGWFE